MTESYGGNKESVSRYDLTLAATSSVDSPRLKRKVPILRWDSLVSIRDCVHEVRGLIRGNIQHLHSLLV